MADVVNSNIMMLKRHPARSRRKRVLKDQLLISESLFYGKLENLGSSASAGHNVKFSGGTWYLILKNNRERKGPSRGINQQCEPHERNSCAPRFEVKSHDETSKQESLARKAAWDFGENCLQAQKQDATGKNGHVLISKLPEERLFVVDSGASVHMQSSSSSSSTSKPQDPSNNSGESE